MSEIHVFIIWEKARGKETEILSDIKKNFKVLQIFEINWSEEEFERNLLRLYGNNLKKASSKKYVCGSGSFLFIIIKDENPKYAKRNTLHGEDSVNVNIFDKKIEYRKIAGGGQRIHASNSEKESNQNIGLILNKTPKDFEDENTDIKKVHDDLVGSKEWDSLKQFFNILNQSLDYVVLRNFEELPNKFKTGFEGDIDILAEDKNEIELVTNAKKISPQNFGRRFRITVNGEKIHCDLRYVGDGYLDEKWEKHILKQRECRNGVFVPNEENYFYSYLYHCLVQKKSISEIHVKKLSEISKKVGENMNINKKNKELFREYLEEFLKNRKFSYSQPVDSSVFFDNEFVNKSNKIKIIKRSETKEQHTPALIRLIQNSFFILKSEGIRSLFQAAKAKFGK